VSDHLGERGWEASCTGPAHARGVHRVVDLSSSRSRRGTP
jgi:hypothetical protein